jgi:deoxyribonucleoside regulator
MTDHLPHYESAAAIKVARLYYQDMTTGAIAKEMQVSRSTVSRMLAYARAEGFVDIQVIDPGLVPQQLETVILERFDSERVHVVAVPELAGAAEWLERVAQYTANYLNPVFASEMTLGIAWGTTLTAVSKHLLRKNTHNSHIVQLNGAGNT